MTNVVELEAGRVRVERILTDDEARALMSMCQRTKAWNKFAGKSDRLKKINRIVERADR